MGQGKVIARYVGPCMVLMPLALPEQDGTYAVEITPLMLNAGVVLEVIVRGSSEKPIHPERN